MICNSSPLIFLSKIGKLDILRKLFVKIKITSSVKEEVLMENRLGNETINESINEGWIIIENPKTTLDLDLNLGKGENSVISLAKEKNEAIILDDFRAIKMVKSLGLKYSRTTTIILECVKRGIINKEYAMKLIDKIIGEGYYIAPKYYSAIFTKLNYGQR